MTEVLVHVSLDNSTDVSPSTAVRPFMVVQTPVSALGDLYGGDDCMQCVTLKIFLLAMAVADSARLGGRIMHR